MTIRLDRVSMAGGIGIAALVDHIFSWHCTPNSVTVAASKRPVALLLHMGGTFCAMTVQGSALTRDEVEALCPGAWQAFIVGVDPIAAPDAPN